MKTGLIIGGVSILLIIAIIVIIKRKQRTPASTFTDSTKTPDATGNLTFNPTSNNQVDLKSILSPKKMDDHLPMPKR